MGAAAPTPFRRGAPAVLLVGALGAAALAILPFAYLGIRATSDGWDRIGEIVWQDQTLALVLRSLELAGIVTLASLAVGTGVAWLVVRTDLPLARFWRIAAALPLALPSYVAAWAWIGWRPGLGGRTGAALVLVSISYPYVYLPVAAALRRCDPALDDIARSLGYGPVRRFVRVTVPQIRVAAAAGGLLVGLYVLSDFGGVSIMRYEVLTHVIYRSYRASFDRTPAAILACVLAVLALVIVAVERRVGRRRATAKVGSGAPRNQPQVHLGHLRWPLALVPGSVLAVALGVPAVGLAKWFTEGPSRPDPARMAETTANSLLVAALGALAVVVVAFPVAHLTARHPGRVSRLATSGFYAGHAVPGVVVGLSLVFLGVRLAPQLYQRLPLLVLAYVVLFGSLALGAMSSSIAQVPPVLDDVSRSLGRSASRTWLEVTARIAAPGIGAAATLVFLTIMKELPATLFLRPTGFDTLATQLWSHTSAFSRAAAAPYAVAIIVLAAVPTMVLSTLGGEWDDRRRARRAGGIPVVPLDDRSDL